MSGLGPAFGKALTKPHDPSGTEETTSSLCQSGHRSGSCWKKGWIQFRNHSLSRLRP